MRPSSLDRQVISLKVRAVRANLCRKTGGALASTGVNLATTLEMPGDKNQNLLYGLNATGVLRQAI